MRKWTLLATVIMLVFVLYSASSIGSVYGSSEPQGDSTSAYTYRVVASFPHDRGAFTEGLVYRDGFLYEGTGLYGRSSLRKVSLIDGKVIQAKVLPGDLFGEGIAVLDDVIVQLTWKRQQGFVYDRQTWQLLRSFSYSTEGWGLTYDGKYLVMSDGSEMLTYLDPKTLAAVRKVAVTSGGKPVRQLNELEYINGEIFANVWQTNRIARINPQTGYVTAWIDLSGLVAAVKAEQKTAGVLNGIAFDEENQRLFVTGKHWTKIWEIELIQEL